MDILFKPMSVDLIRYIQWKRSGVCAKSVPRAFCALSLRLDGKDEYRCGEESVIAYKGDVMFIPSGLSYVHTEGPSKVISIQFFAPQNNSSRLEIFRGVSAEIKDLFINGYKAYENRLPSSYFISKLSELQEEIMDKHVSYCVQQIHDHYMDQSLSVSRLAADCGISEVYLRRLFNECTGCSPIQYLTNVRIAKAKDYLTEPTLAMDTIAQACGFIDGKYFSEVFKKHESISPKQYQKQQYGRCTQEKGKE